MVPPLSSAHEWGNQGEGCHVPTLPDLGRQGEEGQGCHWPYVKVKQEVEHRYPLEE